MIELNGRLTQMMDPFVASCAQHAKLCAIIGAALVSTLMNLSSYEHTAKKS